MTHVAIKPARLLPGASCREGSDAVGCCDWDKRLGLWERLYEGGDTGEVQLKEELDPPSHLEGGTVGLSAAESRCEPTKRKNLTHTLPA